MKNLVASFIALGILTLTSCSLFDEILPDVDTQFTKYFPIQINSSTGESDVQIIDITSSDEYNDFKSNIEGFELLKVTYKVRKDNVPSDMYMSGTVVCENEEQTESYTLGSISKGKISDMASSNEEYTLPLTPENVKKVASWMESPGKFWVRSDYNLSKADGTPYNISWDIQGSNFEIVMYFYVRVKTKL